MADQRWRASFHRGVVGDIRGVVEAMHVQAIAGLADEPLGEAGSVAAGGFEVRAEGRRADGGITVDLFEERLLEVEGAGHGWQAPGGAFGRTSEGAGAQAEGHGGVEADVDAREDHVGLHGHEVAEGDVHAVGGGAVDGPGLAAEVRVVGEGDFAVATEGAADPAALARGGGDDDVEAFGHASGHQGVEERGVDAVVVGQQGYGLHSNKVRTWLPGGWLRFPQSGPGGRRRFRSPLLSWPP